jgi:hypothetical protein
MLVARSVIINHRPIPIGASIRLTFFTASSYAIFVTGEFFFSTKNF